MPSRPALVRRGLWLYYLTIAYNTIEAVVALAAGVVAGSVALIGFGVDSVIEVSASIVAQWRLRVDLDAYVAYDSVTTLVKREEPDGSVVGVILLRCDPAPARAAAACSW